MKLAHKIFLASSIVAWLSFVDSAEALQIKESVSDGEINAFIAADELSRIKVIADRIKSLKSNEGEIEIVEDKDLGEIYIRPIKSNLEPVNIFISTEKRHIYKLLLLPKKMPSEQVFIKNIETAVESVISESKDHDESEAAIALIRTMRSENTDYSKKSHTPRIKINGQELKKKLVLVGNSLRGEALEFINNTKLPVVIDQTMFFEKDIIAISVDNEVLDPNFSTNIYIVRKLND